MMFQARKEKLGKSAESGSKGSEDVLQAYQGWWAQGCS